MIKFKKKTFKIAVGVLNLVGVLKKVAREKFTFEKIRKIF